MAKATVAYDGERVDFLNVKFDQCADKQIANKTSVVKLRAAERDLLGVAEEIRDLLMEAVKGDKKKLDDVFGRGDPGNSRFTRFRATVDRIEFSPMHEKDQRWGHLKEAMDIVEEVLKENGMWNPNMIGAKVPETITYTGLKKRYELGEAIRLDAECNAQDQAVRWSISPGLPEGLRFSEQTGAITGHLPVGTEIDEKFTVTVTNEKGSTSTEIELVARPPGPSAVSYGVPAEIFEGEDINWEPTVEGGKPKTFEIVGSELPEGLSLNSRTGSITGAASKATSSTQFTVRASNKSGEVDAEIKLAIKVAPPVGLTYPTAKKEYPCYSVIFLQPEIVLQSTSAKRRSAALWKAAASTATGKQIGSKATVKPKGFTFTVEPPLPEGVNLNPKSGSISGKANTSSPAATYTVTAKNDSGQVTVDLPLEIRLSPPSALKYPGSEEVYYTGVPMHLDPEVSGIVAEWSVEPALPAGLFISPEVGTIGGTATEVAPLTEYKITGKNSEGETSATIKFALKREPPKSLSYPSVKDEYPILRPLDTLAPTVIGEVDEFSVTPALPEGLKLDTKTGHIDGIPKAIAEKASYEVTAKNESGSCSTTLPFSLLLMAPVDLRYPGIDDIYTVGEEMSAEPQVLGGATFFTVDPPFPAGIVLDETTGVIKGKPKDVTAEASYVVTCSNEAGGESTVLTFSVTCPKPKALSYQVSDDYVVESEATVEPHIEPEILHGIAATYSVAPALPEGVALDTSNGILKFAPTKAIEKAKYKITATNVAGSVSTEIEFSCTEIEKTNREIREEYCQMIESCIEVGEMPAEPSKVTMPADWMVWMVHRAHLNDPTLTDLNFSCMEMPLPHIEPRVAPKLMKAMQTNEHITVLNLNNSNLQKVQGPELAEALGLNKTLKKLDIETNFIDSESVERMAKAIASNEDSRLESWKFDNQKNLGQHFGRPAEEAVQNMMRTNRNITKLGFSCQDAHWSNEINKFIIRNVDLARRRRKGSDFGENDDDVVPEEKPLGRIIIQTPPEGKSAWEIFDDESVKMNLARGQTAEQKRLPTKQQLQAFAKSKGTPLKFSEVAPLMEEFKKKLLDAWVLGEVVVQDIYGVNTTGKVKAWSAKNMNFSIDIWPAADKRFDFKTSSELIIEISDEVAEWLKPSA